LFDTNNSMFTYPATELFDSTGARRVVWSVEEYALALSEGWREEKPEPIVEPAPALIAEEPVTPKKKAGK
jgi:hypothetical protein